MEGWIALHRSIVDHWVWRSNYHTKRWIDLLFLAAWNERDVDLGKRTIHLLRGQLITSTRQLMGRWRTNTSTTLDFLKSLEKSGMITRQRTGNLTIITICNYDRYQVPSGFIKEQSENGAECDPEIRSKPPAFRSENTTQKSPSGSTGNDASQPHNGVIHAVTIEQNNNINNKSLISLSEREEKFFEEVKASQSYIEGVAKNHSLSIEDALAMLDKFFGYISTVTHWHDDVADFKDHFYKWLERKLESKRQNGTGKQKPGDGDAPKDKYAARRGTDVGDKKESDYHTSF